MGEVLKPKSRARLGTGQEGVRGGEQPSRRPLKPTKEGGHLGRPCLVLLTGNAVIREKGEYSGK